MVLPAVNAGREAVSLELVEVLSSMRLVRAEFVRLLI